MKFYTTTIEEQKVVMYSLTEDLSQPDLGFEFELCDINEHMNLILFSYEDFLLQMIQQKTRTSLLHKSGVVTYEHLVGAYSLVRLKAAPFSKKVRDAIVDTYIELLYN